LIYNCCSLFFCKSSTSFNHWSISEAGRVLCCDIYLSGASHRSEGSFTSYYTTHSQQIILFLESLPFSLILLFESFIGIKMPERSLVFVKIFIDNQEPKILSDQGNK
jgi:hypothetical protein